MQIGAYFPQTEVGVEPAAVLAFATAAERLGYDYLVLYDHVLATDHGHDPELTGRYSPGDPIGEVMVLLGYVAAVTSSIGLVTGVLVLPQRQTVLAAKQASVVDVLSAGRLRLGVGVGWSPGDYAGLGASWPDRGARLDEQATVLRRLWTEPHVTFSGRFHTIEGGLCPLPVQRPIPLWFGGKAEPMLRRAARLGDGFMLLEAPGEEASETMNRLRSLVAAENRDPGAFGFEGRLHLGGSRRSMAAAPKSPDQLADEVAWWAGHGASHLTVNTRWAGLEGLDAHLQALEGIRTACAGSGPGAQRDDRHISRGAHGRS